jgi:hypothetical protein
MGKYDKEVKEAKKIIADWVEDSEGYQGQFITLKKNNLEWEKHAIQQSRALLDSKKCQTDKAAFGFVENTIEVGPERLEMFAKEGERIFNAHNAWAMAGPRQSFATIATKLKLGKSGEEKYEAVRKELGSTLESVSKVIRETEGVWNKDLKFAIENQRLKLKAIAKEFQHGDEARDGALAKQMVKVTAEFKDVVQKTIDGFLFFKDKDDWNQVSKGDFDAKDTSTKKQKFEQYQNKIGMIPSSRDMIEKNLKRVEKSFPPEFLAGAGKAGFDGLTKVKNEALLELTRYQKYYTVLAQEFQERHWN